METLNIIGPLFSDIGYDIQENGLDLQMELNCNTKKGLRSFLGIVNYARNHISKLKILLRPLYEKINAHGDKRLKPSDYELVRKIKEHVQNLSDLEIPPENAYIILETNGCMEGWGEIVKWKKSKAYPKSSERICAYASGKFSTTQSTIDAEINACINTLEKLKIYYLDKQEVTLRTDCQAIISFYNKTNSNKSSRVRWIKFADEVTGTCVKINIERIEGKHNTLVDSLSRLVNLCFAECTGEMKQLAAATLYSVEKVLQSPNAFQKNMKITCENCLTCEVIFCGSSAMFQEQSMPLDSHLDITSDHKPGSADRTSITSDSVHAGGKVHNFEGIQKALTKEIKEIKDVFEELKAEVAQNIVDRKHDAIERKNLLIANDNLIAECLSKEVFSVVTNSKLIIARFTEMHVTNTIVEARCMEPEVELSNLRDKSHNDNHDELVNRFSKLEHYKELYDSIKITRAKHIEQVTALTTENVNLKAQILNKVNSVSKDHVKPKVLTPGKHLKESVETIRDIVEEAKVVRPLDRSIISAWRYTKNSQELLEYAIGTCPQDSHQRDKKLAHAPLIRKKQGCSKHMTRNRSRLMNFVKKFIGTVRFGNDHFGAIMGYEDYVIDNSVISRVYYVEGLGHNLFSVGQFCDFDLEVAFRKHSCYVRDTNGVELIKGSRGSNL
uniref:TPA: orf y n=1 Tax=Tanacetum cinerariifolium TaxID=118510 RepID=A0A6L2KMN1_TANCI|nr:TPA: orf y [Tanacetum cinerariifolium]